MDNFNKYGKEIINCMTHHKYDVALEILMTNKDIIHAINPDWFFLCFDEIMKKKKEQDEEKSKAFRGNSDNLFTGKISLNEFLENNQKILSLDCNIDDNNIESNNFLKIANDDVNKIENEDIGFETITEWKDNGDNIHLLTMPNIPLPLQGEGCQPRTIFGPECWENMREGCRHRANNCCEICGLPYNGTTRCGKLGFSVHEVFDFDYKNQYTQFKRLVYLCPKCHLFIHSGRTCTSYSKGDIDKNTLISVIEHGFKYIAARRNKDKSNEYLVFSAFGEIAKKQKYKRLSDEVKYLINKYNIEFYKISEKKWFTKKRWANWKVIINNHEYPTPYSNREEYCNTQQTVNRSNT